MNIYISGGCKNGKSHFAQEVAQKMAREKNLPLYYLATMIPTDEEDKRRIKRHILEREGWGFETVEQGTDICKALEAEGVNPKGVFLIDSVTALLQNEMFPIGEEFNLDAVEKVSADLVEFAKRNGNVVFVSDYIFSDARHFDDISETYLKGLATCGKALAKVCDEVWEVAYGNVIKYKG